ncbi:hypothetical protein V2J09_019530 [Rumex salicifolius]
MSAGGGDGGGALAPRRLRGHKASASCCIASRVNPGVVFTAGEDGCVFLFDLRSKNANHVMELGTEPISSLCFKQGYENIIFVSMGSEVRSYDVRLVNPSNPLLRFNYNKDEINQVACNSKSAFLATADDSGDVKIIDIGQKCIFKTLRAGHSTHRLKDFGCNCILQSILFQNLCNFTIQLRYAAVRNFFLGNLGKVLVEVVAIKDPGIVTGGLDSKLILWDFSKARPFHTIDFGSLEENQQSGAQCCNPAFVHALAVPEIDMYEKVGKICTVARGDGVVSVINFDLELASLKKKSGHKPQKGFSEGSSSTDVENKKQSGRNRLHLDYSMGGHSAAASCVTFSSFGDKGKLIISGGNDKTVKMWDWCKYFEDAHTSEDRIMPYNINLPKKVNWLCTVPTDSDNLVICDTSKVVKRLTSLHADLVHWKYQLVPDADALPEAHIMDQELNLCFCMSSKCKCNWLEPSNWALPLQINNGFQNLVKLLLGDGIIHR